MATYLYLSMTPESLVASMLPPEEFGKYLAVGTRKSAHGRAVYFDLDLEQLGDAIDVSYVRERCVSHEDGRPKHSLYLSIYRVMERVPLPAFNSLWLASEHGKVLELKQQATMPEFAEKYYLYQELCPVHPLIASKLPPPEFARFITHPGKPLFVPRIAFLDIDLGDLAKDAEHGRPKELYYPDHFWHLRGCLLELQSSRAKDTKTVDRAHLQHFPYHCIKNGIFVGDQTGLLFFPFPSYGDLIGKHYEWWHSTHQ